MLSIVVNRNKEDKAPGLAPKPVVDEEEDEESPVFATDSNTMSKLASAWQERKLREKKFTKGKFSERNKL